MRPLAPTLRGRVNTVTRATRARARPAALSTNRSRPPVELVLRWAAQVLRVRMCMVCSVLLVVGASLLVRRKTLPEWRVLIVGILQRCALQCDEANTVWWPEVASSRC